MMWFAQLICDIIFYVVRNGAEKSIVLRPKASAVVTRNHNSNECKSAGFSVLPGYQVYALSILYLLVRYYY